MILWGSVYYLILLTRLECVIHFGLARCFSRASARWINPGLLLFAFFEIHGLHSSVTIVPTCTFTACYRLLINFTLACISIPISGPFVVVVFLTWIYRRISRISKLLENKCICRISDLGQIYIKFIFCFGMAPLSTLWAFCLYIIY